MQRRRDGGKYLVRVFCVDVVFDTLHAGFLEVFGGDLDEVGDFRLQKQLSRRISGTEYHVQNRLTRMNIEILIFCR